VGRGGLLIGIRSAPFSAAPERGHDPAGGHVGALDGPRRGLGAAPPAGPASPSHVTRSDERSRDDESGEWMRKGHLADVTRGLERALAGFPYSRGCPHERMRRETALTPDAPPSPAGQVPHDPRTLEQGVQARGAFVALAAKLRPALVLYAHQHRQHVSAAPTPALMGLGSFEDSDALAVVVDSADTGRLVRALRERQAATEHQDAEPGGTRVPSALR
jgi:hypothetical protein